MRQKHKNILFKWWPVGVVLLTIGLTSCEKFVDIGGPKGGVNSATAFNNVGSAEAATLYMYAQFETGVYSYLTGASGLAADGLVTGDITWAEFQNNAVSVNNFYNESYLWGGHFGVIRNCNLAISGLSQSSLSPEIKEQLLGEALFMRAYMYFNLVNLFGDVPLSLSPRDQDNALLPRSPAHLVWEQIIADLKEAKALLKPDYPSEERTRANQYTAAALLARVYLYQKEWEKAESEASFVIHSPMYSLVAPEFVFKNNSNETIFQLYTNTGVSTVAASFFPFDPMTAPLFYLRDGFDAIFEKNTAGKDDLRKGHWMGKSSGFDFVSKYKHASGTGDEYTVCIRLSEMYLIRAEARAMQNRLSGSNSAEADLNEIRLIHGGLDEKLDLDLPTLLRAIQRERRVEFFGEGAHRWFDLKRSAGFIDPSTTLADEVIPMVKGAGWKPEYKLFPIPSAQFLINPSLTQNDEY